MPNFNKSEEELESNFDKWMYVLKQLPNLQRRPQALQERVFQKLFDTAEIAKFTRIEMNTYQESLKHYRDLKNVIDTSFGDGKAEGLEKGRAEGKVEVKVEIARQMKSDGEPIEKIIRYTGLSEAEIEKL